MADEVRAVLLRARQYLERGWVQGASAVNSEGTPCSSLSPAACRWCLTAAVERAAYALGGGRAMDREYRERYDAALAALVPVCLLDDREPKESLRRLAAYNDHPGRTQAAVLAAVTTTLEKLESER